MARRKPTTPVVNTVGDALDLYWEHHAALVCAAARRQRNAIRDLRQVFADLAPEELTPGRVRGYSLVRKVSSSTARRDIGVLKAALRFCVGQRWLDAARVPHIPLPDEGQPRDFWLKQNEARALIEYAQNDRRPHDDFRLSRPARFTLIALGTAARRNAIEALTWAHVDFENNVIRFDRLPGPRTKKRRAAVTISDWLRPLLEEMHAEARTDFVLDHPGEINLSPFMQRAARETGHAAFADVYPHALRHTVATLALRAGAPIYEVARMLGDTVATVERVYAHHIPDQMSAAINWRNAV